MDTENRILEYQKKGLRFFASRNNDIYMAEAVGKMFYHSVIRRNSTLEDVFTDLLDYLDLNFKSGKDYQDD